MTYEARQIELGFYIIEKKRLGGVLREGDILVTVMDIHANGTYLFFC